MMNCAMLTFEGLMAFDIAGYWTAGEIGYVQGQNRE